MRKQVKQWLQQLESYAPRARQSMLAAMMNVKASQLPDRGLWQALGLEVAREGDARDAGTPPVSVLPGAGKNRLPLLT